jgi:hypothetical protein
MRFPNQTPDDGLLDRAVASLRDAPTPPGPDFELRQRTADAIARANRAHRKSYLVAAAAAMMLIACCIPVIRHAVRNAQELNRQSRELEAKINTSAPPPYISPEPPPKHIEAPVVRPTPATLASDISISGRVYFRGPRPNRPAIDLHSCPQCAEAASRPLYDESLVVAGDGAVQNVVVSISAGLPPGEQYPAPQNPAALDQKGCMFHPHVIATMVGQPIIVKNSDPFLHSVHSMDAELSPAFDFAQPTTGLHRVEPLQVVETFQIKCDLHPWMSAWVRVFNHPYFAVTSADGSFAIRQLPPGKYRLKAWHELLGVREKTIEVHQGQPVTVDFIFDH